MNTRNLKLLTREGSIEFLREQYQFGVRVNFSGKAVSVGTDLVGRGHRGDDFPLLFLGQHSGH